jgi:glyoxylase-like metal-dependent hydrolase (beta-lactamase superfamily II)
MAARGRLRPLRPRRRGRSDRSVGPSGLAWLEEAVSNRPVAVLLTAPWHLRSAAEVVAGFRAGLWAAPTARARFDELPWLDSLPDGIEVCSPRGVDEGQVAFYIRPEQALVVAEFFFGTGEGLEVRPSPGTVDEREFIDSLGELKQLSIERVLTAHGPPVLQSGNDAITAALQEYG